jgi:hypothetical protein
MNRSIGSLVHVGGTSVAWNPPMMSRVLVPALSLLLLLVTSVAAAAPAPESDAKPLASVATATGSAPVAPQASFIARAQRHIEAREYWASEGKSGLQAPNRRHNLRTYFGSDGIRVLDRTAADSPELLSMKLRGMGRADALKPVGPGEVTSVDARVEIRREAIVEWYVNGPSGLEQGFDLAKKPAGDGAIVLELALTGATARQAGDSVRLTTEAGRTLDYGKLVAIDAAGNSLPVQLLAASTNAIELKVDDTNAAYPIVIDPILTAVEDALIQGDENEGFFGASVAGAGDVNGDGYADLIVGSSGYDAGGSNRGAAFVFHGSASGIGNGTAASADAQLDGTENDGFFGGAVAGAGDVNGDGYADVVIGCGLYDSGGLDRGAVFVFHGSASGFGSGTAASADARLDGTENEAYLGSSISGAGDVNGDGYADVIVGASWYDAGGFNRGAVYVFHGSASGIGSGTAASADTQLDGALDSAYFGGSVSGAGDVNGDGYADVIAGAIFFQPFPGSATGAAFVFYGSASGIASGTTASPGAAQLVGIQNGDQFGDSVSGAGDVNGDGYSDLIVGATAQDGGGPGSGRAYVFHGSASGISSGPAGTADAEITGDAADDYLGRSVSGLGDVNGDGYADVVVYGSRSYLPDPGTTQGAAWIFHGGAGGIATGAASSIADAQLDAPDSNSYSGQSASGVGDVNGDGYDDVVIGIGLNDAAGPNRGAAVVFHGGAAGIVDGDPATADSFLQSDQSSAGLGTSVSGAGDVNGDGYADVIVGAEFYDAGASAGGAAFVFLGGASGIADGTVVTADTQLVSNQSGSNFGISVSGAGDTNGDGYADVIVGAYEYDDGETDEGAAFVFLGSASGIPDGDPGTANAQLESNQPMAWFGKSVSGAGDVNGDGYADVIVGAQLYSWEQSLEGVAFVFLGSPSGIADGNPTTASARLEGDQASTSGGAYSVSGAGDVNGDGYADVIVGFPRYDADQGLGEGAAFVFLGSASGLANGNPVTAAAQLESNQGGSNFGFSVSSAGDTNGDGYADVIVGAPDYDAPTLFEGAAFVFMGSASGIADGNPSTAAAQFESDQQPAGMGHSVAGAGDVNGDGFADVIVAAARYDAGQGVGEGAAFVFLGSASGLADGNPVTAAAQLKSNQASAGPIGITASGAGDVNGDGFADVIVGVAKYDEGQTNEGAAFVFLGNSEGRPVLAQQRVDDGSGRPIQPWGGSNDPDSIEIAMAATHPDGRGRVKLETEVCASGVAFGDPSCELFESASWTDVTATAGGVDLIESIDLSLVTSSVVIDFESAAPGSTIPPDYAEKGFTFSHLTGGDPQEIVDIGGNNVLTDSQIAGFTGAGSAIEFTAAPGSTFDLISMDVANLSGGPSSFPSAIGVIPNGQVPQEVLLTPNSSTLTTEVLNLTGLTSLWIGIGSYSGDDLAVDNVVLSSAASSVRWRSRVLYAPLSVTEAGIIEPPNPSHGPWRRISGQSDEADVRVVPEPATALGLLTGAGLLAALARRRRGVVS